jgi:hypothetical protein
MGGFVDPYIPAPAWPQDLAFAGSSWSGTGASSLADDAELEFHLQNGGSSSPALLNGGSKETVSPLELHEQFLQEQLQGHLTHGLMNFEVDSAVERALMAGTMGSIMNTPCAPMICSSNDSSRSEESSMIQSILAEQQQVPPPVAWSSAFSQLSPLVGEETSQSFGFSAVSNGDLLHEACNPDGKKYPQLGIVQSAPLQLHVSDQKQINLKFSLNYNFILVVVILHLVFFAGRCRAYHWKNALFLSWTAAEFKLRQSADRPEGLNEMPAFLRVFISGMFCTVCDRGPFGDNVGKNRQVKNRTVPFS